MSRLSFVPPHLMDMPFVNDSRVPPSGLAYGEAIGFNPGEIPGLVANFSGWDGSLDVAEQPHEDTSVFDFDNYYPDEEFWGVQIIDSSNVRFIRKVIASNGTLSTLSSQTAALPTGGNGFSLGNQNMQVNEVCRLNATTFVIIGGFYSSAASNWTMAVLAYTFLGGNFSLKHGIFGGLGSSNPSGAGQLFANPVVMKLSDAHLFFATHSIQGSTVSSCPIHYYNTNTGYFGFPANLTNINSGGGGHSILMPVSPTRFVTATWQDSATSLPSLLMPIEHTFTETTAAMQSISQGSGYYAADDYVQNNIYQTAQKMIFLLSPSLMVQYNHVTSTIQLWRFLWNTTPVKLSQVTLAGPPQGFVRLSGTDFLVVVPDATVPTKGRTYRVTVNADNSMTLQQSALNYGTVPFTSTGSEGNQINRPKNRGLVLPGNRVLMQHTKNNANGSNNAFYPGRQLTKLLRAA